LGLCELELSSRLLLLLVFVVFGAHIFFLLSVIISLFFVIFVVFESQKRNFPYLPAHVLQWYKCIMWILANFTPIYLDWIYCVGTGELLHRID
jgi:hypothetical protein